MENSIEALESRMNNRINGINTDEDVSRVIAENRQDIIDVFKLTPVQAENIDSVPFSIMPVLADKAKNAKREKDITNVVTEIKAGMQASGTFQQSNHRTMNQLINGEIDAADLVYAALTGNQATAQTMEAVKGFKEDIEPSAER